MSKERLIAGRYRLVTPIGSGGMGVVWQAYDERLHRKVAIKQLTTGNELTGQAQRRVVREGRIAAKLQHPHVIAVYDVLEDAGQSFLVMEYLQATDLAQLLIQRGTLPEDDVARIGAEVADALTAAHAAGVIHRDVKPGNVLLATDGTAKVTDFGISRAVEEVTATGSGLIAGTPAYLSPEVARGLPATSQSDVFSLGATLYAAIEGTPPAGSADNPMAVLYRVAHGDLSAPTRAGRLTGLLTAMLSIDPGRRPTMAEVRHRLETLRAQAPPPAPEPEVAPEPVQPSRSRRRRMIVPLAAALVLLAVAGGVVALLTTRGDPRPESAAPVSTPPASPAGTPTSQPAQPTTVSSPPSTPTQNPPTSQDVRQPTPAATITGYYAQLPTNLPQTWTWLTPRYQQHPAGGYSGYQTFWNRIRTVRTSNVNPLPQNTVEATVDYTFKDGRAIREVHRYTLINQDGRWLIDQSTVISSQTL